MLSLWCAIRRIIFLLTFVAALQAQGKTLVIAILDTGYDRGVVKAPLCRQSRPHPDSSPIKHGTNVISLIAENAGNVDYCLLPIKVFYPEYDRDVYIARLKTLISMHIDILNLSIQGGRYDPVEAKLLKILLNQGVTVFAAAGNHSQRLDGAICNEYPACIDRRIVVVGSYAEDSGKGSRVNIRTHRDVGCAAGYCLKGISQATAIETGRFIQFLSRKQAAQEE